MATATVPRQMQQHDVSLSAVKGVGCRALAHCHKLGLKNKRMLNEDRDERWSDSVRLSQREMPLVFFRLSL